MLHQTGTTPNNYLFAGEQFDPNLNLYYNRARYLSTNTGRFWTMDTYEGNDQDPFSLHKYLYAEGNPVDHADPGGHEIDLVDALAVAAIVVTVSTFATTPVTTSKCRCEVHFDRLGKIAGYTFHHAYLLIKPANGLATIFRAGPSVPADPNDQRVRRDTLRDIVGIIPSSEYLPEFGFIKTCTEPFTSGQNAGCGDYAPANPNNDVAMEPVTDLTQSCDTLKFNLQNQANVVNNLGIPYHNVRQNSNSYVHTILSKVALTAGEPPVNAPGWNNILY